MTLGEKLGEAVGRLLAPLTGVVSAARHARMFHPHGRVYRADVTPVAGTLADVGRRLAGPALVRLSTAWWKGGRELPDALGIAMRFRASDAVSAEPEPGDQDLLLATIRRPWRTPLSPLSTNVHDFLANDYYGVSPFEVAGVGRARLRAVPRRDGRRIGSREERLAQAVAEGRGVFTLELSQGGGDWIRLAEVKLLDAVPVDQEALRFSPFRSGRGIEPRGFVHAIRRATYASSQVARPAHA